MKRVRWGHDRVGGGGRRARRGVVGALGVEAELRAGGGGTWAQTNGRVPTHPRSVPARQKCLYCSVPSQFSLHLCAFIPPVSDTCPVAYRQPERHVRAALSTHLPSHRASAHSVTLYAPHSPVQRNYCASRHAHTCRTPSHCSRHCCLYSSLLYISTDPPFL